MFTEPRVKVEVLNSQFSSVFNNDETEDIPDPGENPIPTIGTITIITSGIEKQLSGLKADKANGPDGISPWFLNEISQKYQRFLLISIKTVSISELCPANKNKLTYLPFTTNGKKSDSSNYRSVSLNCIASKVLVLSTLCTAML